MSLTHSIMNNGSNLHVGDVMFLGIIGWHTAAEGAVAAASTSLTNGPGGEVWSLLSRDTLTSDGVTLAIMEVYTTICLAIYGAFAFTSTLTWPSTHRLEYFMPTLFSVGADEDIAQMYSVESNLTGVTTYDSSFPSAVGATSVVVLFEASRKVNGATQDPDWNSFTGREPILGGNNSYGFWLHADSPSPPPEQTYTVLYSTSTDGNMDSLIFGLEWGIPSAAPGPLEKVSRKVHSDDLPYFIRPGMVGADDSVMGRAA